MVFIRHLVGGLLSELEDNIDRDRFKRLLHYSRRLTNFQSRSKLVISPTALLFLRYSSSAPLPLGAGSNRGGPRAR